ncbi:hypothetical protein Pint_20304 [Pistacia integerrima]|uniref:Uncharacterized protein n=1 Tax=Pistacia integerrima TaxID=434235 RepID=A0ACC0X7F8_9ROSI|nr:hypothetical protein Pint_20304 [Pistacia integerrima]
MLHLQGQNMFKLPKNLLQVWMPDDYQNFLSTVMTVTTVKMTRQVAENVGGHRSILILKFFKSGSII